MALLSHREAGLGNTVVVASAGALWGRPLSGTNWSLQSETELNEDLEAEVKRLRAENTRLRARLDNGEKKFVLENTTLRDRLEQAERKLILLAETASKVHGAIQPLIERTVETTEICKVMGKLEKHLDKNAQNVQDRKLEFQRMREFSKEHEGKVRGIIAQGDDAVKNMHACFPTLVDKIFIHTTEKARNLET